MAFRFASVRAARFGGALIWHSGLMTSFAPNMRYGGAVSRSQDPKLPQGARHLVHISPSISPTSRLHLPHISPASPHISRHQARLISWGRSAAVQASVESERWAVGVFDQVERDATARTILAQVVPTGPGASLTLPYISPTSPLQLPYISATSRLYLSYISFRWCPRGRARA